MEETRICKYCGESQSITKFSIVSTVKGKIYRRWKCSKCHHRTKNERRWKIRDWLIELKKTFYCIQCGEDDFRVLDFHHRNSKDKDLEIGAVLNYGWSKEKIKKEIDKCDALCCKCHRILHWEETHRV